MATSITYQYIKERYDPSAWDSFEEFEEYYLQNLAERGEYIYYTDKNGIEQEIDRIDHHPELKEYEIWEEGYVVTGGESTAYLKGKIKARNFAQACHILACQEYLAQVDYENNPRNKNYVQAARWDYDPNRLSYWGCRWFWSEKLARKSFG